MGTIGVRSSALETSGQALDLHQLKALTYAQPAGGGRPPPPFRSDWAACGTGDYRYCWLRDGHIHRCSLHASSVSRRGRAWRDWTHSGVAGSPEADPDHVQRGRRAAASCEMSVPGYGYENSSPVGFGNSANEQCTDPMFWRRTSRTRCFRRARPALEIPETRAVPCGRSCW